MKKIVIFGVGLIGGSVALALKKADGCPQIVGVGRTQESLKTALDLGVIDISTNNIADALKDADLVFIATPVAQTASILTAIKPYLSPSTVVTDAGSTKADVLHCVEEVLGTQFSQFVGGHPIAGAEKSGVTAAIADLYINKNVVLTPHIGSATHSTRLKMAMLAAHNLQSALAYDSTQNQPLKNVVNVDALVARA